VRKKSASDDAHSNSPIAQAHSRVREQSKRMTDGSPLPGPPAVPLARLFLGRLIYESTRGSLGSPRRLASELFPSPSLSTFFDPSSLVALRHRDHPARVTPPQSSFASSPRSVHLSVRASPRLGSCPLRDFTQPQPHFAKGPNLSLRSVLGLSQPLDGFLRARACRLISSRCHVQGLARSGDFSPVAATLAHREEPSPLPLAHAPLTCLRRLPQSVGLDFEAFICTGPRSLPLTLFTCAGVAPLLEFLSLRLPLHSASTRLPGALRSRRSLDRSSLSRSPAGLVPSVSLA